jgi:hypothetical protein
MPDLKMSDHRLGRIDGIEIYTVEVLRQLQDTYVGMPSACMKATGAFLRVDSRTVFIQFLIQR